MRRAVARISTVSQSKTDCRVNAIDHLVLTVNSIPDTLRFYTETLGMRAEEFEVADGSRRWALYFGQSKINLHQAGRAFSPHAKKPMPGSVDICLLSETAPEFWLTHLEDQGVEILQGPVRRSGATGSIMSIYVRDPDGNLIEISKLLT